MTKLWSFLREKDNREIIGWAGGGLVVAVAGLWAVVTYLFPPGPSSSSAKPSTGVAADCGGIAVGGNVTGSTITAQNAATNCAPKSK